MFALRQALLKNRRLAEIRLGGASLRVVASRRSLQVVEPVSRHICPKPRSTCDGSTLTPPTHVPLATLGGDGAALEDELARKLWATAHSVLAWHNVRPPASAVDGSPPDSEAAAPPGHTRLRRALHLYDGQMAHLIVTLRSASSSSSMIPPITPPLGSSPGKRGPLIKDVNVNVR